MRPIFLATALLGAMMLAATGCQLAGGAAYALMGPPAVPAVYTPPQRSTLIFIENFRHPSLVRLSGEQLERELADQLREHKIAPTIDAAALQRLRDQRDARLSGMSIAQVGSKIGADQILYVELQQADLEGDGDLVRGTVAVRVRWVDSQTAKTLWPASSDEGWPINVQTPWIKRSEQTDDTAVRQVMISATADQLAKLFYEWKPE